MSWSSVVTGSIGVLAVLGLSAPQGAHAQERRVSNSQFMRVYGPTLPPFGFVAFCDRQPRECAQGSVEEARFELTPTRMSELDQLNRYVNKLIEPATDLEVYGTQEHWTLPVNRGDCEDYALLKRQLLMALGWPAGALLMTVVRDEKGEGHAVLTARTAQGDFILDNKVDDIRVWNRTGYTYVMRQSYINPKVWVSLDSRDSRSPAALAGVSRGR